MLLVYHETLKNGFNSFKFSLNMFVTLIVHMGIYTYCIVAKYRVCAVIIVGES